MNTKEIVIQNTKLKDDLQRLWDDNHLTKNHQLGIQPCPKCKCENPAHYLIKNGELQIPNQKLLDDIQEIFKTYQFDMLEIWTCQNCNKCGDILFERTIDGVSYDEVGKLLENTSINPSSTWFN